MTTVKTTSNTLQVQPLPAASLCRAAALIAASFREEGFTRNTHNLSTPAQQKRFAEAGELRLLFSQASGQQLLAATQGDRLAGVAIVKSPTAKPVPWRELAGEAVRRAPRLLGIIGDMRWRQILQIKPAVQPPAALPTAYYTLDILAVSSDYQGQGIGRLLLEHIHARCDQDEQAAGIYTFTGDEKNTHIYRRLGYEVIEVKQGGPLTVWHMFRPHPARDAETFFAALREAAPEQSPARGQKLALSLLSLAGTLIGLALLWRWLRSRDCYFVAQTGSCKRRKSI